MKKDKVPQKSNIICQDNAIFDIYFIHTHTHTHTHIYCGQAHVLATHSISDTDMTTGISKDIHADINIGVHTDTHTHRGKWQKKKKK